MQNLATNLNELLRRSDIWQASRAANEDTDCLPTGQAMLDAALHYGGWPRGMVTEFLLDCPGSGEMGLLLPTLALCSRDQHWLTMIAPPCLPYAPALQAAGITTEHILVARPQSPADLLWSAEQSLRSPACNCLLAWLPARGLHYRDLRRLQLAARSSGSLAFFFRPARAARENSPAALRLLLSPAPDHLLVRILKQRGGPAGQQLQLRRQHALLGSRIPVRRLPVSTSHAVAMC